MPGNVRVAIGLPQKTTDEHFVLAKQMGCEEVVLATPADLPGTERWEYEDLARLRERVEGFGLKIGAIQNTPPGFFNDARLGLPGADKAIANYQETIRNVGRAGISVLAYNFRPDPLYRTGHIPGRGGALVTEFDRSKARDLPLTYGREFSADEMWANYERFIKAVLPVAEESGVRLALHPDDPPGEAIGGVARIFSSFDGFERARQIADDSPAWGLLFCVGCWSEMGGNANVIRGIRHFGPKNQIIYVHFRGVQGEGDRFNECFIGEGPLDVTGIVRELLAVGYDGFVIDDHAPKMVGDEGWNPRARCYQTGYLFGLVRAVRDLTQS
ncbi:MAG TPA: mannonate dehydratase [Chloroflexota bacterium]|nr:mannonate dehydratase [Chloroflexota bacterium]